LKNLWIHHRHACVLALLSAVLLISAGIADPLFIQAATQRKLSDNIWETALLALPMTLVIISGGIDLSVGSTMALATVAFGLGVQSGVPYLASAFAALVVATAGGGLNGWLITRLRVHPLLITLASLAAYRGLAEGLSRGRPVTPLPEGFRHLADAVAGIPFPALGFVLVAIAAFLVLHRTRHGRALYAVGHSERAARFSGIPVDRLKIALYAAAGSVAGLAALFYAARRNTANPEAGLGLELDVIAAILVGGTHINGGRGSIPGTLLGILVIHEAREFVNWRWSSSELNMVVAGALLILSVLAQRFLSPKSRTED